MHRVSPGQFGDDSLPKRSVSDVPDRLKTGLGGDEKPRQLSMFMSGREIMDEYQPLDGDRATNYESGDFADETDSQLWSRKLSESKMAPKEYDEVHFDYAKNMPAMSDVSFGNSMPVRAKHEGTFSFEDREHDYYVDKEMQQDAKYEEKLDAYESPDHSLYNQIGREGVQKPISLNDPGNKSAFGFSGKPQVAGGHHRLSAQFDQDPDKLMPVLHFSGGTVEAKQDPIYKYS